MKKIIYLTLCLITLFLISSCVRTVSLDKTLTIVSGSENEELMPILKQFEREHGVKIEMVSKGSVDIMQMLKTGSIDYDAVWPANSLWISMGDKNHIVKHQKSIATMPVVVGIKKSKAKELGFIDKKVSVKEILDAIENKQLKLTMTSATQSNSGASAYLGFLYALAGKPNSLSISHLESAELKEDMQSLLAGIERSSGSSGWLKKLFLQSEYDAMINYEALIITTNQELIKHGKEPLYLIYPYDGLVMADSPLGFVSHGDKEKEDLFLKLQDFLLSKKTQNQLASFGRRTGFGGNIENADKSVFNSDWGIDVNKVLSPIKLPSGQVIEYALNLYQSELKKPSLTVFCLDFSGSMFDRGDKELKEAMKTILDQELAKTHFLQFSTKDIVVVVPFNHQIIDSWEEHGNNADNLKQLYSKVHKLEAAGGTDIYFTLSASIEALNNLQDLSIEDYFPSIILMTDGQSEGSFEEFKALWLEQEHKIPVFSITFGDADDSQLHNIANLTTGRVFNGRHNLINAFKKARGYN